MDIPTIFKDFLFPVAISMVLLWFILREVWQYLTKQIDLMNAARSTEREEFLAALTALTASAEKQQQATHDRQTAIIQQLTVLTLAIDTILARQK